jgi:hypothetical protein
MVDCPTGFGLEMTGWEIPLQAAKQAVLVSSACGLTIAALIWSMGLPEVALGLAIGFFASFGYIGLLWVQWIRARNKPKPAEAVASIQKGWISRACYIFSVSAFAGLFPAVNLGAVLVGLLGVHAVVVIWGVLMFARQAKQKI